MQEVPGAVLVSSWRCPRDVSWLANYLFFLPDKSNTKHVGLFAFFRDDIWLNPHHKSGPILVWCFYWGTCWCRDRWFCERIHSHVAGRTLGPSVFGYVTGCAFPYARPHNTITCGQIFFLRVMYCGGLLDQLKLSDFVNKGPVRRHLCC